MTLFMMLCSAQHTNFGWGGCGEFHSLRCRHHQRGHEHRGQQHQRGREHRPVRRKTEELAATVSPKPEGRQPAERPGNGRHCTLTSLQEGLGGRHGGTRLFWPRASAHGVLSAPGVLGLMGSNGSLKVKQRNRDACKTDPSLLLYMVCLTTKLHMHPITPSRRQSFTTRPAGLSSEQVNVELFVVVKSTALPRDFQVRAHPLRALQRLPLSSLSSLYVYMCMYVCMYIHIYIYIYTHPCVQIHVRDISTKQDP